MAGKYSAANRAAQGPGGRTGTAAASEPLDHPDGFVYAWGKRRRSKPRRIAAEKAATMVQIKRHHPTDAAVASLPNGELGSAMASPVAQANAARVASRQPAEMRDSPKPC